MCVWDFIGTKVNQFSLSSFFGKFELTKLAVTENFFEFLHKNFIRICVVFLLCFLLLVVKVLVFAGFCLKSPMNPVFESLKLQK